MKTSELDRILLVIAREYPDIRTELDYDTPFQFLVAVMLSAQTTDKQVNKVTPPYFALVRSPEDALRVTPDETERLLSGVNYFKTKAKHVRMTADILVRVFRSDIPRTLQEIQTLPGVGIKTAKVVLSVLYDLPYVGVDTHVHRVLNRLKVVKTKTPEETDRAVEKKFTTAQKIGSHHPLVLFGRYRCLARKPRCSDCPLREECPSLET